MKVIVKDSLKIFIQLLIFSMLLIDNCYIVFKENLDLRYGLPIKETYRQTHPKCRKALHITTTSNENMKRE